MAKGKLEVLLVDAQGIKDRESQFLGEEKKLEWNETITFDVEYDPDAEDQPYKLVLQIFDKHKISEDNLVGESTIYIKDVLSLGAEKGKEELKAQKYRVVLPDNTYSGEISVAVTFTLNV
ncbi:hypothetical protein C3L33_12496, partial [Rhododendron williamsianum]